LSIAGQFVSSDLERAVMPMLSSAGVLRLPFLEEREFWLAARMIDACINLRYPSAGETSGVGVRMMGIGKVVIFTGDATVAALPETVCLRVDPGPGEEENLAAYICWLARDRTAVGEIGRRAAEYVGREHSPEKIARQYWGVLRSPEAA